MGICLGNGSDILLPPKKSDQLGFIIPNMVDLSSGQTSLDQFNDNKLITSQSPQLIRTKSKLDQNYKYLPSISWSNHHFCR